MRLAIINLTSLTLILSLASPAICVSQKKEMKSFEELESAAKQLDESWSDVKQEYRQRFKLLMEDLNQQITTLKKQLDGGDAVKREDINEKMADLERMRDDIRQVYHELTTTLAARLSNLQGDLKDVMEDIKD